MPSTTRTLCPTVFAASILLAIVQTASAITYDVNLTAAQEVPSPTLGGATPSGTATLTIDVAASTMSVSGSYSGMTSNVSGSHLHGLAAPGDTAGVLLGLSNDGGTSGNFSGGGALSTSEMLGLMNGLTYLNIHTANNVPGEIRGQVVDNGLLTYSINLTVAQEVPTPTVTGFSPSGSATVVVDPDTLEFAILGTYSGMTSNVTGSHLHGFAGPGDTAGVLVGLDNTGGTQGSFNGMGTLTSAQFDGLVAGNTYINIHTANNSLGEIRGQVVPEPASIAVLLVGLAGCAVRRRAR